MHTTMSIKKQKSYCIFIQQRKFKKYVLACILDLITSLLKSRELGQYFKNSKNFILFSFSIWGYDLYVRRIPDIKFFC
jgi:hypothetical protein